MIDVHIGAPAGADPWATIAATMTWLAPTLAALAIFFGAIRASRTAEADRRQRDEQWRSDREAERARAFEERNHERRARFVEDRRALYARFVVGANDLKNAMSGQLRASAESAEALARRATMRPIPDPYPLGQLAQEIVLFDQELSDLADGAFRLLLQIWELIQNEGVDGAHRSHEAEIVDHFRQCVSHMDAFIKLCRQDLGTYGDADPVYRLRRVDMPQPVGLAEAPDVVVELVEERRSAQQPDPPPR